MVNGIDRRRVFPKVHFCRLCCAVYFIANLIVNRDWLISHRKIWLWGTWTIFSSFLLLENVLKGFRTSFIRDFLILEYLLTVRRLGSACNETVNLSAGVGLQLTHKLLMFPPIILILRIQVQLNTLFSSFNIWFLNFRHFRLHNSPWKN